MAAVSSRARWGDTLDDDDVGFLPPTEITGPDAKGVKTVVEYKKNDKGDTVKVTTRVKIVKMDKKQYEVGTGHSLLRNLCTDGVHRGVSARL